MLFNKYPTVPLDYCNLKVNYYTLLCMYTNYISGLKQHLVFFRQQYWNHGHTYFTSVNSAFTSVLHVIAVTEGHWSIENPVKTAIILQPRARLYSNMFLSVRNIRLKQKLFFSQKREYIVTCLWVWGTPGQNRNYSSAKSNVPHTSGQDINYSSAKNETLTVTYLWVWGTYYS